MANGAERGTIYPGNFVFYIEKKMKITRNHMIENKVRDSSGSIAPLFRERGKYLYKI